MLLKVIYLLFFTLIRCRTNELKQILDTFVLIFIFFFWLVFISNVSTADPSITVLFAGYIGRGLNCWCHQREGVAKNILCLEHFHFSSQRHAFFFFLRIILAKYHVVLRETSALFLVTMRRSLKDDSVFRTIVAVQLRLMRIYIRLSFFKAR